MQQPPGLPPGWPAVGMPAGLPGMPGMPPGGFPGLPGMPPGGFPGMPPGGLPGMPPGGLPPLGSIPGLAPPPPEWLAQLAASHAAQLGASAPGAGAPGTLHPGLPPGWPSLPGLPSLPPGMPSTPGAPGAPGLPPGWPPAPQPMGADAFSALLGQQAGQVPQPGDSATAFAATAAGVPMPPQLAQLPPPLAPPPQAGTSGAQAVAAAAQREDERKKAQERNIREGREQAERRQKLEQLEKMKCHLHKKAKDSCKFCKKYKEAADEIANAQNGAKEKQETKRRRKPDRAISEEGADPNAARGPLEIANTKNFGFGGLLQTHVVECAHFKSLLTLENFDQLVDETFNFATSVEPYNTGSGTVPSALFCCVYRFFTLGLDDRMLRRLLNSQESAYLRCAGFLYVRFGLPHEALWDWLGEYVLDDEVFQPTQDSDQKTTIGDYVESILAGDKYFNTVFPRLPNSTRRKLEEKLAPVPQYRKRTKANKEILDVYREVGTKIEACIDGDWLRGSVMELDDDRPTRIKVQVRLEDGTEDSIHLGMMIVADNRTSKKARGRSRSRSPGGSRIDWSRHKGRSDKELVDELRSANREKAVCSTGKDYARKPVGYKAACALPREQGSASFRLMEEETFVPMNHGAKRRSPSPQQQAFGQKRQSAEHQARMQQLFEKYGNVKSTQASQQSQEVDRPDVMRLG